MDSSHDSAVSAGRSAAGTGADAPPARPLHLRRLMRSIGMTVVFKLSLLAVLYTWFFGPAYRLEVTPERLESHLLAPTQPTLHAGETG